MALTYDQLTGLIEKHFIPRLQDNVYSGNAFLKRSVDPSRVYMVDGGTSIQVPIAWQSTPSAGKYFSDFDVLDTNATDDFTAELAAA